MESSDKKRRAVHEQLRTDHIDTLEILQTTQDENEKLKQSLKQLQEKLDSMNSIYNTSDSTPISAPSKEQNEMISLLQKNRDLIEQVSNLQQQVKQYQLADQKRQLLQQKTGGTSIEELSSIITKLKQKEYYDGIKLKEYEKNHEFHLQAIEQLKQQYEEKLLEQKQHFMLFQNQLFSFQSNYNETKNDLQQKIIDYNELIKQNEHLQSQLTTQSQQLMHKYDHDMKGKDNEIMRLHHTIEQYEHLLQEKTDLLSQYQQELLRFHSTLSEIQDPHGLRTNLPTLLQFTDSDCDSIMEVIPPIQAATLSPRNHQPQESITPRFSPIPHPVVEKKEEEEEEVEVSEAPLTNNNAKQSNNNSPLHGNVRFQEFMDLKRENRELKLRLAELTSHTQGNDPSNHSYAQQGMRSHLGSSSGPVGKSNKNHINVAVPAIPLTRSGSGLGTPTGANHGTGNQPTNHQRSRRSFDSGTPLTNVSNASNGIMPMMTKSHTQYTLSASGYSGNDLAMSASATTLRSSTVFPQRQPSGSIKFPKVTK